jgi:UDP-N-acetylglucosamine diphosphorylase/glucosamine-1-phosphate N-acetyltransferase
LDEQGGPIAYCITEKQVDSKHQIKIDRPLRYKNQVAKIQFPWDLTQLNAKEIESDFILVTKGRKSAAISKTNRVWGAKKIFIEKGAVVEGAFINAIQGPVYIGVKATIMEGSMLRGPLAIGEGACIKMGAKIYGATTIGPNSVVGGEIKNSIFFGNSNKAHDGYLGDAVIGEWCNLGAGTSNSNIKNNAGPIRITTPSGEINVGLKCGVMMGDYVRTSINSSINSGAIIGPCSVLLEAGLSPRVIPPFSWGQDGITKYKWPKVIEDIKRWKALKHCAVSEWEEKMLETIYSSN